VAPQRSMGEHSLQYTVYTVVELPLQQSAIFNVYYAKKQHCKLRRTKHELSLNHVTGSVEISLRLTNGLISHHGD
jgi:hypothetical protein